MNRRSFLVAALATPLMAQLLVACGEDSEEEGGITFPGGPNDVVLKVTSEGGFVPAGFAFVNTPSLLISGDGRAFEPGAITLEYPGPLLMPMFVRSISDDGITKVLQLAESAGLLATPPDYTVENLLIADAPTTVLTIQANGTTYVHRAEALGMDQPDGGASTPARENLAAFIATLVDLGAVAGAAVGASVGRGDGGQQVHSRDVERCENVASHGRPDYWDVTYDFRGEEHRVQMNARPGATITVNQRGEPSEPRL